MFASIEEYEQMYGTVGSTMCNILEYSVNKTQLLKSDWANLETSKCEVVSYEKENYFDINIFFNHFHLKYARRFLFI